MKKILTAVLLLFTLNTLSAQEIITPTQSTVVETNGDTILILKGQNDVKIKIYEDVPGLYSNEEEMIYEGVYLKRVNADRNTLLDALPFAPRRKSKNSFSGHASGIYGGFANLSNSFCSFGESNKVDLNLSKTWEIAFNLLSSQLVLSQDQHWGMTFALGWGFRTYRLNKNEAFENINGITQIIQGNEEISYTKSRLRHFYFRIPVCVEWQTRVRGSSRLFAAVGPEFEIRHGVKSKAKVNGKSETLSSNMHVRPVTVNLLAQLGYGNIGLYARYNTLSLFAGSKGPDVTPYSFGVMWYW